MSPPSSVEIHELLKRRWSPRAFADRAVEPEKIGRFLEAARWAASSFNAQPWSFLIATRNQPQEYDRLLKCLVEGNQAWAKVAPVLMLSIARLRFEHNQKDNRHAYHDVGLAVASLIVQATADDLFVHQMAGFDAARAREEFDIPEDYDPVAAIAVGYQGDASALPEPLRERETAPRTRKALEDFVFGGGFGQTASW